MVRELTFSKAIHKRRRHTYKTIVLLHRSLTNNIRSESVKIRLLESLLQEYVDYQLVNKNSHLYLH